MSILNPPQTAGDLVSLNGSMANATLTRIPPSRDITGLNFSNGDISFRGQFAGTKWFYAPESAFHMRLRMFKRDVDNIMTPFRVKDRWAPNYGFMSNLFQNHAVSVNGHIVDRIDQDMAQIDALKHRKNTSWGVKKSIGQTDNFWHPDQHMRVQQISQDGYASDVSYGPGEPQYGPYLTRVAAGLPTMAVQVVQGPPVSIVILPHADNIVVNGLVRVGDRIAVPNVGGFDNVFEITGINPITVSGNAAQSTALYVKVISGAAPQDRVSAGDFLISRLCRSYDNICSNSNVVEISWVPPSGFWGTPHAIPPGGEWNFRFTPHGRQYQLLNIAEDVPHASLYSAVGAVPHPHTKGWAPGDGANQYSFLVEDFYLDLYTFDGPRYESGSYLLDITSLQVHTEQMPINAVGLTNKTFNIKGRTHAVGIAFQDLSVTSDPRYSTGKFKIRPDDHTHDYRYAPHGQDMNLVQFYISYNNQSKPSPNFTGRYFLDQQALTTDRANFMTAVWKQNLFQTNQVHNEGGGETEADFKKLGFWYYSNWPKDAYENVETLTVYFQFARAFVPPTHPPNLLVFTEWKTAHRITTTGGQVMGVSSETGA